MKNLLLLFAFTLACLSIKAQTKTDTLIGVAIENYIIPQPNINDTAISLSWVVFGLRRESGTPCMVYVSIYNRYGEQVKTAPMTIPASVVDAWGANNAVIDNWIFDNTPYRKKIG
jgi:hypothetical protein